LDFCELIELIWTSIELESFMTAVSELIVATNIISSKIKVTYVLLVVITRRMWSDCNLVNNNIKHNKHAVCDDFAWLLDFIKLIISIGDS
jgi:hypothetical protein